MTGPAVAALVLAAAMLVPSSPRRRAGPGTAPRPPGTRPVTAGVAGIVGALAAAVLLPVTASLAAAVLAATLGRRHRGSSRHRRAREEARALETALEVLVGELRVGAHPVRAFTVAAAETDHSAVATALHAVAARARLGADVPAGLRSVAGSSSLPVQWERLAVYWQLGSEHGLAVATLMHAAQRDITERERFFARVRSGLAGARASAAILAALPVLGVLLGQLVGAEPVRFLLGGAGGGLLLAGTTLVGAGLLWSDRITGRPA